MLCIQVPVTIHMRVGSDEEKPTRLDKLVGRPQFIPLIIKKVFNIQKGKGCSF